MKVEEKKKEPAKTKLFGDFNLPLIFGVTLMAVLGVASIAPAFPKIMIELNLSEAQVGLLITVFTLPGVFLTPFMGVAADRYGRKKVLVPSLLLFGVAGGLGGFSQSFSMLLVLRFFQGVGAAALGSLNTTIIGDLYQGPQRATAMGLNASMLSIGTSVYPLIGGALATLAWNFPFLLPWLAVPLGLAILRFLENPEPQSNQELKLYLNSAWQGIKDKKIIGIFVSGILMFIILYGSYLTYFSILLGQVYKASSLTIGIIMFAMSISTALTASQLGRLSRRYSKQSLLKVGFAGYAISMTMIIFVNKMLFFVIPALIFGVAHGLIIPSLQTLLAEQAPLQLRGIYMALNGAMLRIGQTLGPLVIGIVFTFWGYGGAFGAGAILAVVGVIIIHSMLTGSSSNSLNV